MGRLAKHRKLKKHSLFRDVAKDVAQTLPPSETTDKLPKKLRELMRLQEAAKRRSDGKGEPSSHAGARAAPQPRAAPEPRAAAKMPNPTMSSTERLGAEIKFNSLSRKKRKAIEIRERDSMRRAEAQEERDEDARARDFSDLKDEIRFGEHAMTVPKLPPPPKHWKVLPKDKHKNESIVENALALRRAEGERIAGAKRKRHGNGDDEGTDGAGSYSDENETKRAAKRARIEDVRAAARLAADREAVVAQYRRLKLIKAQRSGSSG